MYTHDPVSLLSLHHAEHSRLMNEACSIRPVSALRRRASIAYYAAVRRVYVHARVARTRSMDVAASRVTP